MDDEYLNAFGEYHRENGPAIELNGSKWWYLNGKLHRDNGLPAVEMYNGDKSWHIKGLKNRENGLPAIERANGCKMWFVDNKLHRGDDLPAVICENGDKEWYFNGHRHRSKLPAVVRTVGNFWYKNGKIHRGNDLPAVEMSNGEKYWYIEGVNITTFREKYIEVRRIRAQKLIYFWIIPRIYRPGSESAKRLAKASWQKLKSFPMENYTCVEDVKLRTSTT